MFVIPSRAAVIEKLRDYLSQAEQGELVSIFIAGTRQDGTVVYGWNLGMVNSTEFVGAVTIASHQLVDWALEEGVETE